MISKSLQKSIDKMNEKIAEALVDEIDDDDDRRIRGSQSSLLYIVSTGNEDRIRGELAQLDKKWAMWATTGAWPVYDQPLQGRLDNLLRALDDALVEEKDPDDEHKILAAKSRLVAVLAAEDPKRAEAEVTATEKDHAAWATSGAWPAMTIKPSRPPREPAKSDDSTDDDDGKSPRWGETETPESVERNKRSTRIAWGLGAALLGWWIW